MGDGLALGELANVDLRKIWANEAADFTPWLAENISRLSHALGMELEALETEKSVENFSADIYAKDAHDGSRVLIENQLEKSDHTHLGQILTYLAGLDAKTVIWISPQFREPHLSAIRWLNDHTDDDFAFFAVRLKAVRIGDSLPAPVFEVLERPSAWERQLKRKAARGDQYSGLRMDFWEFYRQRHPHIQEEASHPLNTNIDYKGRDVWLRIHPDIIITLTIANEFTSIIVRGDYAPRKFSAWERLKPHLGELSEELGARLYPEGSKEWDRGWVMAEERPLSCLDKNQWPRIADWLEERRKTYTEAIRSVLADRD